MLPSGNFREILMQRLEILFRPHHTRCCSSSTGHDRASGIQDFESPRPSMQSAHEGRKVFSPKDGRLYPQEIPVLLISARG